MRPARRASLPCLAAAVFALARGAATPSQAAPAAPASAPVLRSSLAQIASRVAADLAPVKDALVVAAPLRSDEPAPRAAELVGKVVGLTAGALGSTSTTSVEQVPLATAQALARNAKWVVYLQVEVTRGQLHVSADAYRAMRNVWERARQPTPGPEAHAFASGRIDGEARSYLAPVPLVELRVEKVAIEDRDVVAVACGDAGDRGALEIVVLSRRRLAIGRARAGRFVARKEVSLHELSGIAPSPLREPLGGVAIVPPRGPLPGFLDVGITDRAHGTRFDDDLQPMLAIAGVPFATPYGDACASFQGSTLAASVARCGDGDALVDPSAFEAPLDAIASATYVTSDGTVHVVSATRDPRTSELRVRADGNVASVPHAGAQIAVADLDQDGTPEIVSTLDVLAGRAEADAVVISTLQKDGSLRERGRVSVPSGARAVGACPPDGAGPAPLVIATQGELWIVR